MATSYLSFLFFFNKFLKMWTVLSGLLLSRTGSEFVFPRLGPYRNRNSLPFPLPSFLSQSTLASTRPPVLLSSHLSDTTPISRTGRGSFELSSNYCANCGLGPIHPTFFFPFFSPPASLKEDMQPSLMVESLLTFTRPRQRCSSLSCSLLFPLSHNQIKLTILGGTRSSRPVCLEAEGKQVNARLYFFLFSLPPFLLITRLLPSRWPRSSCSSSPS